MLPKDFLCLSIMTVIGRLSLDSKGLPFHLLRSVISPTSRLIASFVLIAGPGLTFHAV